MKQSKSDIDNSHDERVLKGVSICPGIGIGCVHLVDRDLSVDATGISTKKLPLEQQRYTDAVGLAKTRLNKHVASSHGGNMLDQKAILEAHQVILADESFHDQVRNRIVSEKKAAEWCVWQEASSVIAKFSAMRDPYFQARGEDIRDLAHNLIAILYGIEEQTVGESDNKQVLISRHMHSSDAIGIHRNGGVGFASESRALMSHAAILLKGFVVPAVGGVDGLLGVANEGDTMIVDGLTGVVVVRPSAATIEKYKRKKDAEEIIPQTGNVICCSTADGSAIRLMANIENLEQVNLMHSHGLCGVGLFRTEFLISSEGRIPTEEEQFNAYCHIVENADGQIITIRTFDIGGDKSMGILSDCMERNPSLGVRGIRRHLSSCTEEFCTQLRAILRSASLGNVEILIPMVTTVGDLVAAKRLLSGVIKELREQGVPYADNIALGAMIETPAAAVSVSEILSEVEFISVGTNDLLQYFMAADRDNEKVIHYQDATSPAFLWLMEHIIMQARNVGREEAVTVCGEVASDVRVLPNLLRMGYRSFSISPVSAAHFRTACAGVSLEKNS